MKAAALLLLFSAACATAKYTGSDSEVHSTLRHSRGRKLLQTLPLLPHSFTSDPQAASSGQVFYDSYYMALGEKRNFTFAQLGYLPSSSFTVNATVDAAAGRGLQLYCAPGAAQALNRSAPLPSLASALGTTNYNGPTALLNVNTTHTGAFSRGSLFRRTGLGAANSSYTEEGISYSDPITCVVQYGNTSDALTTNRTHASVRITLTMHYPQPEMAPSEQAAVANIYSQCCNSTNSCKVWKSFNTTAGQPLTDFCKVPGQACYSNGSLAVLDTSTLRLSCDFPYRQLAAFQSLASLSIGFFCRPRSYGNYGCYREDDRTQSPPSDSPATWAGFFGTMANLKNLQSLSIVTYNPFNGTLLPANIAPGQATICDLVQAKLSYLKIGDPLGGYYMESLNGTLPACLLDSQSQLRTLLIANTNLTGFEEPMVPSKKVAELVFTSNHATFGSIPDFFGGLTNLTALGLTDNPFIGNIPVRLSNLTSLKHLDMSFAKLSGSVPASLARSPVLETLDLSFNNFTGSVPISIGASTSLRQVNIGVNNFSGSLPYFSAFSQLRYFKAAANNLTGALPSSLGRLQYLQDLLLYVNRLTGTLPAVVPGALQDLKHVDLRENSISGMLRPSWTGLPSLRTLDLSYNALNGSVPASLFRAPALETALLNNNQLTGTLPAAQASNQTSVLDLELANNMLSGSIPSALCTLANLTSLNVSSNQLSGGLQDCLGSMDSLSTLDISNNLLSGSISRDWGANLTQFRSLWAANNNFSGPLPGGFSSPTLSNATSSGMTVIDFTNNSFSGSLPVEWKDLKHINALLLGDNYLSGTIPGEWDKLADPLASLELNGNNLTGAIPTNISTKIPHLKLQYNNFQEVPLTWYGSGSRGEHFYLSDLSIQGNNLSGPFPDGLARSLPGRYRIGVTYLDVSDNNFSGPLPRATNATAPFFNDLIYFNASSNNLTGPIPEDFGHTELFNTSSVYYQIGAAAFTRSAAFDVSNNQLSGDLPTFLTPSRVPRPLLKTSGVTLLGNVFTCPSTQDKAYLNLTSCSQPGSNGQTAGTSQGSRPATAKADLDETSPGTDKAGLGKGAIIGIVIGVICALGVLTGVLAFLLLPHRRRAQQGWQKETLDGQRTMPKQNVELASASGLA